MKWHRETADPARYESGPFVVEHHGHRHGWFADGPGVDPTHYPTKRQAQTVCGDVASARAADPEVTPVIGDAVIVSGTRRGHISSIMNGEREPLFCITFARGRRLCLFRREIEVIVP
ncbi:hypothetical protein PBI_RICH_93 [Mycobacterium phage Rich]|uniref:Uncharacterized protein n=1 Tax=Mycobacterium phage Rich TaxID=1927021 RepID=A0A1L6BZ31_9CAUD|nr:hypothetical protein PBI_RICH_93 [Mycobacterium phage Rich]